MIFLSPVGVARFSLQLVYDGGLQCILGPLDETEANATA